MPFSCSPKDCKLINGQMSQNSSNFWENSLYLTINVTITQHQVTFLTCNIHFFKKY